MYTQSTLLIFEPCLNTSLRELPLFVLAVVYPSIFLGETLRIYICQSVLGRFADLPAEKTEDKKTYIHSALRADGTNVSRLRVAR
jgi:hypothetical protein